MQFLNLALIVTSSLGNYTHFFIRLHIRNSSVYQIRFLHVQKTRTCLDWIEIVGPLMFHKLKNHNKIWDRYETIKHSSIFHPYVLVCHCFLFVESHSFEETMKYCLATLYMAMMGGGPYMKPNSNRWYICPKPLLSLFML